MVPESRLLKYMDTEETVRTSKSNKEEYAEGKMRVATLGKKTSGLQQKNVEVKIKKNKQKAPGNGEGAAPVGHLSLLIRA